MYWWKIWPIGVFLVGFGALGVYSSKLIPKYRLTRSGELAADVHVIDSTMSHSTPSAGESTGLIKVHYTITNGEQHSTWVQLDAATFQKVRTHGLPEDTKLYYWPSQPKSVFLEPIQETSAAKLAVGALACVIGAVIVSLGALDRLVNRSKYSKAHNKGINTDPTPQAGQE